jgi:RimJ/RimL family protein N-acetyltransferase
MIFTLDGLTVTLRKPESNDASVIASWISSSDYADNIGGDAFQSPEVALEKVRQMLQDNADDLAPNKYLIAVNRRTGSPIGLVTICKIDWKNRNAEMVYIVGDASTRGGLAAGDINVVVHNHLFYDLNLYKVYGYVFDHNAAALRFSRFGGKFEGTLRRHRIHRGRISDVHVFSITRDEFSRFVGHHARTLLRRHIEQGLIKCQST